MSRILIADDNPHARRMGREILAEEGHEILLAANADEALGFLAERPPDLVIIDRKMPGCSGVEIRELIKSQPELSHVKVVLLVGATEVPEDAAADGTSSDGILYKPLDPATVVSMARALLSNGDLSPASTDAQPAGDPPESSAESDQEIALEPSNDSADQPEPAREEDAFAFVVEQALRRQGEPDTQKDRVRAVVSEVLEAAVPAIIDRVTERVMEALRDP
jgi:CheY-like chemotaxis protein